ncbi:helix-turn-helix domain-containing protein [Salinibacter ruber]|uniref:helix-turn-helix domain-containing protein n=1 Tax=Salinibacter ruber TaxID=146919 RepID=UPI003C6E682B
MGNGKPGDLSESKTAHFIRSIAEDKSARSIRDLSEEAGITESTARGILTALIPFGAVKETSRGEKINQKQTHPSTFYEV